MEHPQVNLEHKELLTKKDLLTEAEAALLLDVAVGTLQVWRCKKRYKLPYIKIGRNVRYTGEAIAAFRADRTVAA
jgi:hypothetical protein